MQAPAPPSPTPRKKPAIPHGFRAAPKPKQRPLTELSLRELQEIYDRNEKALAAPGASTSTYVQRLSAEQARIKRLVEVDHISTALKETQIINDDDMSVDEEPSPVPAPAVRMIGAKERALARFASASAPQAKGSMSLQEAIEIEQRAHAADAERHRRILEKKQRMGLPVKGEALSKQEREARIWAFMNYKPTESDLEDDSEESDSDSDDPASWFVDEDEDGVKGQAIVSPDELQLAEIIRVDESKVNRRTQNTFFDQGS